MSVLRNFITPPVQYQRLIESVKSYYLSNQLNHQIDDGYLDAMLAAADPYDIISFDVFDTLLTRLFECPIDLFAAIEGCLREKDSRFNGFAQLRLAAEEQARIGKEEVTLQEIYLQLMRMANYSEQEGELAKQYELALELASIIAAVDHLALIERLKLAGKKIIIVSDIYLEKSFIGRLLESAGINTYDELFVSSEYGKTKHTGHIWEEVCCKMGSDSILHIGDNLHADVNVPKRYGIATFHYTRLLSERRVGAELSPDLVPFSLMAKVQFLQRPVGQSVERAVWQELGTTLGAMILWSFTDWLAEHVRRNQIEHIYFCARDAQIIEKVWQHRDLDQLLGTSSSYLYLSRKVVRYPACYVEMMRDGKLSDASLTFLVDESIQGRDTYRIYLERIGLGCHFDGIREFKRHFGSLRRRIRSRDHDRLKDYIQNKLAILMLPNFKRHYESSIAYYRQEGLLDSSRKVAIVDLGWAGTLQMALQEMRSYNGVTNNPLYGFYYGLNNSANGRYYHNGPMFAAFFNAFNAEQLESRLFNSINLLENFHSADHETTIGFVCDKQHSVKPILKEDANLSYQKQYNETFRIFQEAALKTVNLLHQNNMAYGVGIEWISTNAAQAAMYQVFRSPNRWEIQVLGGIQHATIYDHVKFNSLVTLEFPRRKRDVNLYLYRGFWPCGVMSYWRNNKHKINKRLYAQAAAQFNSYPEIVRKYLIG